MPRALVWFRDDLRLHDHLALERALAYAPDDTVLVAVLNPRRWGSASIAGVELPRLGRPRARFWIESVAALRDEVRRRGGELIVRVGDPTQTVAELVRQTGADRVFAQAHVAHEETTEETELSAALARLGAELELCPGHTLVHVEDLPFAIEALPDVFTAFRKKVEPGQPFHSPRPTPTRLPGPSAVPAGELPEADQIGADLGPTEPERRLVEMRGGEQAGLRRLSTWAFDADALGTYKTTRNGLLEPDDSSRLSPWLALGCLSPRRVLSEVRRYEAERGANESTYWLIFELLWRDYFALLARREGTRLFARSGIGRRDRAFSPDLKKFDAWREGRTGIPFVDAFMRQLRATGFMSNRGRQNVASFLAKSLGVDWRWGAAWFEACLIDYDPASNWGNWQYAAGVGTDPRDRVFNVVKQAFDYDVNADFVRRWVPEVGDLAGGAAHTPWRAEGPRDYPDPISSPSPPPGSSKTRGGRSRRSRPRRG